MSDKYIEVILAAIKNIKNEILLYSIVVIALIISLSVFDIGALREVICPIIIIATIGLLAYLLKQQNEMQTLNEEIQKLKGELVGVKSEGKPEVTDEEAPQQQFVLSPETITKQKIQHAMLVDESRRANSNIEKREIIKKYSYPPEWKKKYDEETNLKVKARMMDEYWANKEIQELDNTKKHRGTWMKF